jgi:aspartate kinase
VDRSELKKAMKVVNETAKILKPAGVIYDENIAKVSVVGVGMRSHSGVAAKMFKALAEKEVNILMISTSEIKISVVIDQKDVAKAVAAIYEKFKLGKKASNES